MNLKNNSGRSVKFLSSSFFYFRSYWSWGYQYLLFYREYRHYRHEYCDALRDLVPFVQFKEREKSPWRSVAFSKVVNTPPWVFFTFFKLYKWYQIAQRITIIFICFVSCLIDVNNLKSSGNTDHRSICRKTKFYYKGCFKIATLISIIYNGLKILSFSFNFLFIYYYVRTN